MSACPCGTTQSFEECCSPLISGEKKAETAEQLMRSRYSAYTTAAMDYVLETTHPEHREDFDLDESTKWAKESKWNGLTIVETDKGGASDDEGTVEFIANYTQKGVTHKHHELSTFKKIDGAWFFEDGKGVKPQQFVRKEAKIRPNDRCICGSGRKYKKCCLGKA